MNFHTYFKRRVGPSPAEVPALGAATDPEPAFDAGVDANKDSFFIAKVGGVGNPIQRVAIGYRFSGGAGLALVAKLWAYDRNSKQWYLAASGNLADGALTYLRVPCLADPPQTQANLTRPTAGGIECLVTIADPGGLGNGTYHFVVGADTAQF